MTTVLLVEPSELSQRALARWLCARGYTVACVESTHAALATLRNAGDIVHLVLTTWRRVDAPTVMRVADEFGIPARVLSGAPPEPQYADRWILKTDLDALAAVVDELRTARAS